MCHLTMMEGRPWTVTEPSVGWHKFVNSMNSQLMVTMRVLTDLNNKWTQHSWELIGDLSELSNLT